MHTKFQASRFNNKKKKYRKVADPLNTFPAMCPTGGRLRCVSHCDGTHRWVPYEINYFILNLQNIEILV